MDTSKANVGMLFAGSSRYRIPPYQREYQWTGERWHSLWRDIGALYEDRVAERNILPSHFIGAVILEQEGSQPGMPPTFSVIDGQQRFVTLLILLAAIRDHIAESKGQTIARQHGLFFVRDDNQEVIGKRLEVQEVDLGTLDRAMNCGWRVWYGQARHKKYLNRSMILQAYTYFRYCLWKGLGSFDDAQDPFPLPLYKASQTGVAAESLWDVADLSGTPRLPLDLAELDSVVRNDLFVLNILLEKGDEDGPTIFDTMNAKRTQLEQWDFIRNSFFIRVPHDKREGLFANEWGPVQAELVSTTYSGLRAQSRDAFVYDYLISKGEAAKQGTINRNRGHEQVMRRVSRLVSQAGPCRTLTDFISTDFLPSARAWTCAVGARSSLQTPAGQLRLPAEALTARDSVMALSSGPPIPVILHYIGGWASKRLGDAELVDALRVLESYVARHVMCQTPMSPFRAHFMQVMNNLQGEYGVQELYSELAPTWKSDPEVRHALTNEPLYEAVKPAQLGAIFRGLEAQLGGPGANLLAFGKKDEEYSVEHVYPKSGGGGPNAQWAAEFAKGRVSRADQAWIAAHRHFIGNLTLVTNYANKRLHTSGFLKKQKAYRGQDPKIRIPPLAVNEDIKTASRWTKAQIQRRTTLLAEAAVHRWPTP